MESSLLWLEFLKNLAYYRLPQASFGRNFPRTKTMREERDDIISLRGENEFHGDGGKIYMEQWGLYMLSNTQ